MEGSRHIHCSQWHVKEQPLFTSHPQLTRESHPQLHSYAEKLPGGLIIPPTTPSDGPGLPTVLLAPPFNAGFSFGHSFLLVLICPTIPQLAHFLVVESFEPPAPPPGVPVGIGDPGELTLGLSISSGPTALDILPFLP